MAASIEKATAISLDRMRTQIEEYYTDNYIIVSRNGCHNWRGHFTGNYVSKKFKMIDRYTHKEKNLKIQVHIVVCFLKYRRVPIKGQIDCSHLCHNNNCLNPEHLSLEPRVINHKRKQCKKQRTCTHHGDAFADCIFN